MEVLPFGSEHLNEVYNLNLRVQPNPWSLDNFKSELGIKDVLNLVVMDSGLAKPLGYLISRLSDSSCELLSIGVDDSRQRSGIGGKLLNLLKEEVSKRGGDVFLEVNESNIKAKNFYEKNGFSVVQKRPQYYKNGDACLVMKVYVAKRNKVW